MGHQRVAKIAVILDETGFVAGQVTNSGETIEFDETALELTLGEILGLEQDDEDDDYRMSVDEPLDEAWVEAVLAESEDDQETPKEPATAEFPMDTGEEDDNLGF